MFSPQWINANGDLGGDNYEYLCELLAKKTPDAVSAGLKRIELEGCDFKPTFPKIVKVCFVTKANPSLKTIGIDFQLPDHSLTQTEPTQDFIDMRNRLKKLKK